MGPLDHHDKTGLLLQGGGVLSAELLQDIAREAKAQRRSPERMVRQWLEDMHDGRKADAAMKRVREGKTKVHDAESVFRELGI